MNPFQESLQKGLGEGLAKGILRSIELVLVIAGGFLLCQKPIVALVLLAIAAILLLLLVAYAFGWWSSYRNTRQKIQDLESRVDYHDQRQAAEDAFFEELNKKGLPRLIGDPPEDDDHTA